MKTFFAVYDGSTGIDNSLEGALQDLQNTYGDCAFNDVQFYEAEEIEVQLLVKQVPVKQKSIKEERI
jgi:hypothetical protein